MKIPRPAQNALLIFGSLLLFATIVESGSYVIRKFTPIREKPQLGLEGEIWNFSDARKLAEKPGRIGDISRLILAGGYEAKINDEISPEQKALREEAPNYPPSSQGHHLWKGSHAVTANLDDDFELLGATTGKTKYRVHYSTDAFGRRLPTLSGKKNILFLGCSFTFGQGVSDEHTFPIVVGKKLGARVYNAGIPGTSPSVILKRVRSGDFPGEISPEQTTVILTLIPEHILRVIGTTELFRTGFSPMLHYPYVYEEEGKLVMKESFADDPTYGKHLLNLFAKTNFSSAFHINLPVLGEKHYRLMARIIQETEQLLRARYPQMTDFVVAFYPTGSARKNYAELRDVLMAQKIKVFDFTFINGPALLRDSYYLPYDWHPSPLAHQLYSDLLIYELTKKPE